MSWNKENERTVSIAVLIKRIIPRWKMILLCGLVFALIGCIYTYTRQKNQIAASQEAYAEVVRSDDELSAAASFNQTADTAIADSIDRKMDYISHSLISKLNSCCYKATAVLYIEANGSSADGLDVFYKENESGTEYAVKQNNQKILSIQSAIEQFLYYGLDYSPLYSNFDVSDSRYITELIQTEKEAGNLIISFYCFDATEADEVIEFLVKGIEDNIDDFGSVYGEFKYHISLIKSVETVNPFTMWIEENIKEIDQLSEAQTQLNRFNGKLPSLSLSMQINKQKNSSFSYSKVVRNSIIMWFLGMLISALAIAFYLVFGDKVLSEDDLKKGLNINAAVLHDTKKDDEQYSVFVENMDGQKKKYQKIAIIGDLPAAKLEEVQQKIAKNDSERIYISLSNPLSDKESRRELSECDGTILVSEVEKSSLTDIRSILSYVDTKEIDVVGSVLI